MAKGLPTSLEYIRTLQKPLQFNKNGKFTILHLTDIHEVDPEMDDEEDINIPINKSKETLNVIEECIKRTNPDLVVFGGDNISGFWREFTYDYMVKTVKKIIEPVKKRNIPLAIVFGNHDSEGEEDRPFLRRENQIAVYAEYENFRSSMNDEDITGCANCCLPVLSSDGNKTVWAIWCMDSNDYIRDEKHKVIEGEGYGYIHEDQIKWYEKRSEELKKENNGKPVPSILFQHIPVNQELDYIKKVTEADEYTFERGGSYYKIDKSVLSDGTANESPCPPNNHREQFESWVKTGNMVNAFFGHDHVNNFTFEVEGIKLTQTIGAGYHTYGNERGGRVIVLDEKTGTLETETITVDQITDLNKEN